MENTLSICVRIISNVSFPKEKTEFEDVSVYNIYVYVYPGREAGN